MVVGLLTPFASELMSFTKYCQSVGNQALCGPELRINLTVARVLQGLLAFTAVMLINVWWLHRRSQSGIYADPSSIASLASLLHHPEVVNDFRRMDPDISKKDMVKALASKRYRLDSYRTFDGCERYGVVVAEGHSDVEYLPYGNSYVPVQNPGDGTRVGARKSSKKRSRICSVARDVVLGSITAGILAVIGYYFKVGADSGFERFMDSESFGPRFMMTVVGVLIYGQWKRLERGTSRGINPEGEVPAHPLTRNGNHRTVPSPGFGGCHARM